MIFFLFAIIISLFLSPGIELSNLPFSRYFIPFILPSLVSLSLDNLSFILFRLCNHAVQHRCILTHTHALTHFFFCPLSVEKLNLKNGKDKEKETKIDTKIQGGNTKGKGVDPYKDIDQRFMESKNILQESESSDLYALLTESSSQSMMSSDDQQQSGNILNSRNILLGFDDRPKKNPKIPESKKNLK